MGDEGRAERRLNIRGHVPNATAAKPSSPRPSRRVTDVTASLTIDIWSDVVCPWCFIGKRRFEAALERVRAQAPDLRIDVRYRAYQLDPNAPSTSSTPVREAYARKFGGPERADAILLHLTETAAADGLDFRFDIAQRSNTVLSHRVLWWAAETHGLAAQARVKERLLQAYFTEGENVGDPQRLAAIVADELDVPVDSVVEFLESGVGNSEVAGELQRAVEHDITGVPTYVINGAWAIPGAQDPDTFERVLLRAAANARS
ncbi:MAG: hypothetical protein B7C54_09590 [Acidimicrobiales bacterium mtb01]|nr:DsbA family oxidoreductase [Actinomycetota bacterium]TEX45976.1 MAG: hypothetical protein B7C54_09590 [Acidimicrobiales bacterium mtb01]